LVTRSREYDYERPFDIVSLSVEERLLLRVRVHVIKFIDRRRRRRGGIRECENVRESLSRLSRALSPFISHFRQA